MANEGGDNPEWNHTFELEINPINSKDILTLTIMEHRLIRDDFIANIA